MHISKRWELFLNCRYYGQCPSRSTILMEKRASERQDSRFKTKKDRVVALTFNILQLGFRLRPYRLAVARGLELNTVQRCTKQYTRCSANLVALAHSKNSLQYQWHYDPNLSENVQGDHNTNKPREQEPVLEGYIELLSMVHSRSFKSLQASKKGTSKQASPITELQWRLPTTEFYRHDEMTNIRPKAVHDKMSVSCTTLPGTNGISVPLLD